ncbi:dolichyl-diphosphooligosaccharide--protein glycosyltransferase subunit 1-like [Harmonia axyridis]|uniref:dolichyl-diphosphooligosaccharide--protein glycosyltransferase subunit 1-like n=1 Tax=Harmonia axyridis TaxID=115357 RepID=UPI001E27776C|nr:dolichyl-diphosphooligosaccharide--protein glycosyltransferase subunit 1-like [Harmonia axyridis]
MQTELVVFIMLLTSFQELFIVEGNALQNVHVIQLIDITSFIVKTKYKIIFKNIGPDPIDKYIFEQVDGTVDASFTNGKNDTLSYESKSNNNSTVFILDLNHQLQPQEEYTLKIRSIFPSKLIPATKFSKFDEEHSFLWRGNSIFYSRYPTKNYRFMFLTESTFNRNIKMSIMYDSSVRNMFIYYARNITPLQYKEIVLTFTSPMPMYRVKKLLRNIYVPQLGKILIQDQVIVQNAGPKLFGPYFNTQSDYWMYTHLPKSAENIKFFDVLGNNSKTFLHEDETHKTLKFIPRYSLRQGGWKSTYIVQYNVPIYEYVFKDVIEYYLKIRAMDHILNDVLIEDAEVKVFLPDGARLISVNIPPKFDNHYETTSYTTLSILGRCTVNLEGKMLLEEHINDVVIKYHYSPFNFLIAPFFIISTVECIFFALILWLKHSVKIC